MFYHPNSCMDFASVIERMQFPKNDDSAVFVIIVPYVKPHLMNMRMVSKVQVVLSVAVEKNIE